MIMVTVRHFVLTSIILLIVLGNLSTTKAIDPSSLDTLINTLNKDISADSVESYIQHLQDYGTRKYNEPNRKEIAEWIAEKFINLGIVDVKIDSFMYSGLYQYNVIATVPCNNESDEVIIIGAHYDSRNAFPSDIAPGADDNGSGISGMFEIARTIVLNNYSPEATLKFIAFAVEEEGCFGSKDYAQKAKQDSMNISLMINIDMIGYTPFELDSSTVDVLGYPETEDEKRLAVMAGTRHSKIATAYSEGWGASDNSSFSDQGYKAICFTETVYNPHYHSSSDSIQYCNIPYIVEVTKSVCATLIGTMYMPPMVQNLSISDGTDNTNGNSVIISWDEAKGDDISSYKVLVATEYQNYDSEYLTTNTEIIVDQLTSGLEYYFGVVTINLDGIESAVREKSFIPFTFTLDQGILVIDETLEMEDALNYLTDEEVDDFYGEILEGFSYNVYDLEEHRRITIADMGIYSTIVWHGNDDIHNQYARDSYDNIIRFLDAGGNLFYNGYRPSSVFLDDYKRPPVKTSEGDFLHDYFKYDSLNLVRNALFSGAVSSSGEYSNQIIDTTKTKESLGYHLKYIESIFPSDEATSIFFYNSEYDSVTVEGSMKGESVGVEYIGDDFKVITLSFPLYYTQVKEAKQLMRTILNQKFGEPISSVEETALPKKFELRQNYPNPFNPETIINYELPITNYVELSIYNIIGQRVATLVNEQQKAGTYSVQFTSNNYQLTSGVYFYQLRAGSFVESRKMVLLK